MMALTKALVMLDFRETIVWTDGIQKAASSNFRRLMSRGAVILIDRLSPFLAWMIAERFLRPTA
ncbi:MAG: hypothetical protein JNM56_24805 [Planctomycetia bacterium]|nr:hypothetical protein [Planctomycetia bacterium]